MRCPGLAELPPPLQGQTGWPWAEESLQLPATMPDGADWPRVTVVTPSYNQGRFLEETIRSVLLQGYPSLEYIIMDGGSTDGSAEIIRRYQPWLSFVHIGPDDGQADAIGSGFQRATGDILAWLNSDDRFRPGALARVADFFVARPRVVFGNGDVNWVDAKGRFLRRWYAIRPNRLLTSNLGRHGWPQQGCFWRRRAYAQVGGIDRTLQFCMDRDLFIRVTGAGPGRRIPGPPLGDHRRHDEAKTSTMLHVWRAENKALIEKYGHHGPRWRRLLLELAWLLWRQPADIRSLFNRAFGVEW